MSTIETIRWDFRLQTALIFLELLCFVFVPFYAFLLLMPIGAYQLILSALMHLGIRYNQFPPSIQFFRWIHVGFSVVFLSLFALLFYLNRNENIDTIFLVFLLIAQVFAFGYYILTYIDLRKSQQNL